AIARAAQERWRRDGVPTRDGMRVVFRPAGIGRTLIPAQLGREVSIHVPLFHIRQDVQHPGSLPLFPVTVWTVCRIGSVAHASSWRKKMRYVMVAVDGEAELLKIIRALHAVGGLANLLHSRQEQADQDGDYRDYDEQFNQRERPS